MEVDTVRQQLARIIADSSFGQTCRLSRFLTYVVEETLEGRADRIKAYPIGLFVFDRGENFDPQNDSIVRVEAARLRSKLSNYYADKGSDDPVIIEIPVGKYLPQFRPNEKPRSAERRDLYSRWAENPAGLSLAGAFGLMAIVATYWLVGALQHPDQSVGWMKNEPLSPMVIHMQPANQSRADRQVQDVATEFMHGLTTNLSKYQNVRILWPSDKSDEVHQSIKHAHLETNLHDHNGKWNIGFRLINSRSGYQLWSDEQELPSNTGSLHAQIQKTIRRTAAAISSPGNVMSFNEHGSATSPTGTKLAHDKCVYRAIHFWKRYKDKELAEVQACLDDAIATYPDAPAVLAASAFFHLDQVRLLVKNEGITTDHLLKAKIAAEKAYYLDAESIVALRALYSVYFALGDLDRFEFFASRALKLNPHDPYSLADIGRKLAYSGSWDRGTAYVNQALGLVEHAPEWFHMPIIFNHYRLGRFKEALAELEKIQHAGFCGKYIAEAAIYASLGKPEKAKLAARNILRVMPDFDRYGANLLNMWNFEEEVVAKFRSDLAEAGIEMAPQNDTWKLAALRILQSE